MPFIIDARNMGGGSIGSAAGGDTSTGTRNNVTLAAPWDENKEYLKGDLATNNGDLYQAQKSVPAGVKISDEDYWALVVAGDKSKETEQLIKKLSADKMDKTNPTGAGSFSMNRKAGTVVGVNSHAEGYNATAQGYYSHAEGHNTTASGYNSHAEGYSTTAEGDYSHVEGYNTTASGGCSHVQGKCNIEDTSNIYADIIGNGASTTARSNAATVDWEGNAWFAGDVYTGSTSGTNKDEGSKKLATEEYVNSSIAAGGADISLGLTSAAVGQIIKVKAIDESGKPTAWEAANMPTGKEDFEFIRAINITESTNAISISTDENGNSFSLKGVFIYCSDSIGKGLDYKTISYSDNNGITVTIPNALNASRVTKIKAENDGGIYSLYGGWAGEDKGTINRYEVVTDSPFTPITSIKITFGAAVSQGSVKVWGKK